MKMKKIIIIVVVIIFVLMLIPIPTQWKNGVTEYKAILYKYTKVHTSSDISFTGYDDGWELKILGIRVGGNINADERLKYNENTEKNVGSVLLEVSGDYSRKVAENAGFFSPTNSIDYFVAIHPYAEEIIESRLQQIEKETPEYKKLERLLHTMRTLRKQQRTAYTRLEEKLASLKEQLEATDYIDYQEELKCEINHIEKILGSKSKEAER